MLALVKNINKLFTVASRISARTFGGLAQHGLSQITVGAVRSINGLDYRTLSPYDKAAVDEAAKLVFQFAKEYVDHHDESKTFRLNSTTEAAFLSHVQEIIEAADRALLNRFRSAGYDRVVKDQAYFSDNVLLKQLIFAMLDEASGHIHRNAD